MIGKINNVGQVATITTPSFKSTEKQQANNEIESSQDIKNAQAYANYNIAKMNITKKIDIKPLVPTIILPEDIDSLEGERIYSSDGKLHSIVNQKGDLKTIYKPFEENENEIRAIETYNTKTGKLLKHQYNSIDNGKLREINITQYSPIDGKEIATSYYKDGKLAYSSKTFYHRNGTKERISHDNKSKGFFISKSSRDDKHHEYIEVSEDMKFITIDTDHEFKGHNISKRANFYNGGLISYNEYKNITLPNYMAREPLKDKDLKPARYISPEVFEKVKLEDLEEILGATGEKTYYSNGAVESFVHPEGKVYFSPEGKITKLETKLGETEFNGKYQTTTENLENGDIRRTDYHEHGIEVEYQSGENYKTLHLSPRKQIEWYEEGTKKDGNTELKLSLGYNEQGFLQHADNY